VSARAAMAAVAALAVILNTHVTVAPGVTVGLPVLLLPVLAVLCAAAGWAAVRLARAYHPAAQWRPLPAGTVPCRCPCQGRGRLEVPHA